MANMQIISGIPAAVQAQNYSREVQKKLITSTLFGKLSGQVDKTAPMNTQMLPDAIFIRKSSEFNDGTYADNIPWVGKLSGTMIYGDNTIEGTEESRPMRYLRCFYQREAKAVPGINVSVDGNLEDKFYKLAQTAVPALETFFAEQDDYNGFRALVEGFSENVTIAGAWTNSAITDYPTVALHPNVYVDTSDSAAQWISWNSTYSTYETAIDDAIDGGAVTDLFKSTSIDKVVNILHKYITPLGAEGQAKAAGAKWVYLMTPEQMSNLLAESSSAFLAKFSAGAIEASKNVGITGVVGNYREVLFIQSERAPVWNLAAAAGSKVVYSKPSTDANTARSNSQVSRTVKGSADAGTGTGEIGVGLGRGALAIVEAMALTFKSKLFDFETKEGFAGIRMVGNTRADFRTATASVQPVNTSSFLFITCTGTQSI